MPHVAKLDAGGHTLRLDRGGGDDDPVVAVGLALQPAAGETLALGLGQLSLLLHREAFGLEVLRQLRPRQTEVALHGFPHRSRHVVGRPGGRGGHGREEGEGGYHEEATLGPGSKLAHLQSPIEWTTTSMVQGLPWGCGV